MAVSCEFLIMGKEHYEVTRARGQRQHGIFHPTCVRIHLALKCQHSLLNAFQCLCWEVVGLTNICIVTGQAFYRAWLEQAFPVQSFIKSWTISVILSSLPSPPDVCLCCRRVIPDSLHASHVPLNSTLTSPFDWELSDWRCVMRPCSSHIHHDVTVSNPDLNYLHLASFQHML